MTSLAKSAMFKMQYIERRFKRPPIIDLIFDVSLHNPDDKARWFILPTTLDSFAPSLDIGIINSWEVLKLEGKGQAILGRFSGLGGFYALSLPAKATVTLRKLPLSLWEETLVNAVKVDVIIASSFVVGDTPATELFPSDITTSDMADVMLEQAITISQSQSSEIEEWPVSFMKAEQLRVMVPL